MHASFKRTQPLDRMLILIDVSDVVLAATCIKCITSRWGGFEVAILEFVNFNAKRTMAAYRERVSRVPYVR
jgi:hypothetical protein